MHPQLLIDCGQTLTGPHYTGIQRYVRRTLREAVALLGRDAVGGIAAHPASGWTPTPELPAHAMEGLPAVPLARQARVRFEKDSHVLLADRFWHSQAWSALDELIRSPARMTLVLYDLLSLKQPRWFPPGVGERFGRYLHAALPRAERVICLTRHVAADLADWAQAQGLRLPRTHVVAPGHAIWTGEGEPPPGLRVVGAAPGQPFVLQVGTLEPRKNHRVTLEAMRQLWASGSAVELLWIGQPGWLMEDLEQCVAAFPRLRWLPQCTDAQLAWCYRNAAAVLYPSAAEGYGLPVAEAAAAGARVIASDTPAHREIVATHARHDVTLCTPDAQSLLAALQQALGTPRESRRLPETRDWNVATRALLAAMEVI